MKENSSVTSEFLITRAAHVRSFNFLGLPFLLESLVSAYSPLRWPFFHTLIWLTVEQHSSAGGAHVLHQSSSVWMWESERSETIWCRGAPRPCPVTLQHQSNWEGQSISLANHVNIKFPFKKRILQKIIMQIHRWQRIQMSGLSTRYLCTGLAVQANVLGSWTQPCLEIILQLLMLQQLCCCLHNWLLLAEWQYRCILASKWSYLLTSLSSLIFVKCNGAAGFGK